MGHSKAVLTFGTVRDTIKAHGQTVQVSIAERTWPIAPPFAALDDLVEQVARDNVVPFLGPYISAGHVGELGLPSPRRSGYADTKRTLSPVAQHFELQLGRHALLSFLNQQFLNPNQSLLTTHQMIAALPCRVVTSRLDDVLEHSLREAHCSYRSMVGNLGTKSICAEAVTRCGG